MPPLRRHYYYWLLLFIIIIIISLTLLSLIYFPPLYAIIIITLIFITLPLILLSFTIFITLPLLELLSLIIGYYYCLLVAIIIDIIGAHYYCFHYAFIMIHIDWALIISCWLRIINNTPQSCHVYFIITLPLTHCHYFHYHITLPLLPLLLMPDIYYWLRHFNIISLLVIIGITIAYDADYYAAVAAITLSQPLSVCHADANIFIQQVIAAASYAMLVYYGQEYHFRLVIVAATALFTFNITSSLICHVTYHANISRSFAATVSLSLFSHYAAATSRHICWAFSLNIRQPFHYWVISYHYYVENNTVISLLQAFSSPRHCHLILPQPSRMPSSFFCNGHWYCHYAGFVRLPWSISQYLLPKATAILVTPLHDISWFASWLLLPPILYYSVRILLRLIMAIVIDYHARYCHTLLRHLSLIGYWLATPGWCHYWSFFVIACQTRRSGWPFIAINV